MSDEDVSALEEGPVLSQLRLTAEERAALAHQGFVCGESRRGRTVYKLRFRGADGRQRVCALGADPGRAERVRRELAGLQRARRLDQALGRLRRDIARQWRQRWAAVAPQLVALGYRLHGRQPRRPRRRE